VIKIILTLKENNKKIIFNNIIPKTDRQEEIEKLYRLYSAVNYEYGYLKHGLISFYIEKPEEFEITSKSILFYSTYIW